MTTGKITDSEETRDFKNTTQCLDNLSSAFLESEVEKTKTIIQLVEDFNNTLIGLAEALDNIAETQAKTLSNLNKGEIDV